MLLRKVIVIGYWPYAPWFNNLQSDLLSSLFRETVMYGRLAWLFSCFLLSGCLSTGRDFATGPVRNIENNVTTEKEIFGYFGEPVRRGLENGYETWTYSYQYYELGQLREFKDLYVVFNKDKTVRTYSFTGR
jgi:hypothetical protein